MEPQRQVFGTDIGHRRIHRVQLDEGQHSGRRRDDEVEGAPVPGHQLQRVGDARQENQADREKGNHQDRTFRIGEKQGAGQSEKAGRKQVGDEQHDGIPSAADMGDAEQPGQQSDQKEGEDGVERAVGEGLSGHRIGHAAEYDTVARMEKKGAFVTFPPCNHPRHHQERLENYDYEYGGDQVAAVTFRRVVEGCPHDLGCTGLRHGVKRRGRQKDRHIGPDPSVELPHGAGSRLFERGEVEEGAGVAESQKNGLLAPTHTAFKIFRDENDSHRAIGFHLGFRCGHIRRVAVNGHLGRGVEQPRIRPAERGVRFIDHRDWGFADQVGSIHIVIQQPVNEYSPDHHEQD